MKITNLHMSCLFFLSFMACSTENKSELSLKILNTELLAYDTNSIRDTINILNFEVRNNSDKTYYFNPIIDSDDLIIRSVYKNGINVKIFNRLNNEEISYFGLNPSRKTSNNDSIWVNKNRKYLDDELDRLNLVNNFRYYAMKDNRFYFFIHPKEVIYFNMYINLTDSVEGEFDRIRFAKVNAETSYYAKLFIASDSTNFKKVLPRHILQRIKENSVTVYHGLIESDNSVPVKVLK